MKYIIVDSREKPKAITGILNYFDRNGIEYDVSKLFFGDYMDYNNPSLVIDRKQNIAELAKNCTSDHERFRRELEKVKKAGARLVILVEQNRYKDRGEDVRVEGIEDIIRWSSPHTQVRGEKVFRILISWCAKYPISVEFCDKRSTGRRIAEILYNTKAEPQEGL
jgi:ERCC4-type nuclease